MRQVTYRSFTLSDKSKKQLSVFGKRLGGIARWIFLLCFAVVLLYPLLIMLSISVREANEVYDPTVVWIPRSVTLAHFRDVFDKLDFGGIFLTTARVSVICSFLQMCCCCLAGYGFARFRFPGKRVLFACLLFSIIVPPQLILIPSYTGLIEFDFFGIGSLIELFTGKALTVSLIDTMWAYYLTAVLGAGIKGGLFCFIFLQFFKGMPAELEEAACIDGCNRFGAFCRVMLPNSRHSVITVMLFSTVWYWNDYYYNSIYFNNLPVISRTLINVNTLLGSGLNTDSPYLVITETMAAAFLSVLPPLILYVVFQRFFTESIERTGIVG